MSHSPVLEKTWKLEGWCVIGNDGPLLYTFTDNVEAARRVVRSTEAYWAPRKTAKVRLEITEVPETTVKRKRKEPGNETP